MKPYIEFKKKRELGEILSDTFAFIRNEFKSFCGVYFKIVGPYLVVMLICYGFYISQFGDPGNIFLSLGTVSSMALILAIGLLLLLSALVSYVMSQATVLFYIKSYVDNRGTIDFTEVKKNVYGAFWKLLGLAVLVSISLVAGFMVCILPGIYLYVPLMLSFSILVFNNETVTDAFSNSFTLIKNHWWITFATIFVVFIIVGIAGLVFSLPGQIYTLVKVGIFSGEVDAESYGMIDPLMIIFGVISTLAQFLLNIISVIASVLIYFDLNEKKNFTGTYERIKNLGGTD